ncbi:hypothetical protein J6500_07900 [Bradyrhizobium sp. WSM 1704]|uniref:SGNH/GDSL hydrolase family protein n=1 Tax=Bradyrhizobium semiaridum TaxID=2821404 RepID=UPI001CE2B7FC|nr:hypothetical protein [Bradyrhizobium semiaridum]MCA6121822.1 hypothetical protein [Bradyrhizobium semiaridum]
MSSSTSNFKHWIAVYFVLVLGGVIPFVGASEWLLRTRVLAQDPFQALIDKMQSNIRNVALGDSHAAAVSEFDAPDFLNLGMGGTKIGQMSDRAHYYFTRVKPGEVIVEADPHLFADYRLDAPGSRIPESYSARLVAFDERHRRFMTAYWERYFSGGLKPKFEVQHQIIAPRTVQAIAALGPLPDMVTDFSGYMDYSVRLHTPVSDFRERAEARIYVELIDFLIARGATVCLMNYPVDRYYRERADRIAAFANVKAFYEEIAKQRGIRYVSFWSRFEDQDMFQNADHVNEKGSRILAPEARKACFSD